MSRLGTLLIARDQSLQWLPTGPEPHVFTMPLPGMSLDLPLGYFTYGVESRYLSWIDCHGRTLVDASPSLSA
jgi:hypothetical protein